VEIPKVTKTLPPISFPIPRSIEELLETEASFAGYHAVSTYLGCPERSRLRALGVRRKPHAYQIREPGDPMSLDALSFGQVIHTLLAIRVIYGQRVAERLLLRDERPEEPAVKPLALMEEDRAKALLMLRTYDATFPLDADLAMYRYVGIETPIVADVSEAQDGTCLRTARYDAVIQQDDPVRGRVVYSLEHKTAARGGQMREYTPQAMVQVALWNSLPTLVAEYGPMVGVIFDVLVKQVVPRVERLAPRYITKKQSALAIEYLRLPEKIQFPMNADGSYPRLLNECYGRYSPCDYVDLCLEGAWGEYEQPVKEEG
jgi:hypothetical protein